MVEWEKTFHLDIPSLHASNYIHTIVNCKKMEDTKQTYSTKALST